MLTNVWKVAGREFKYNLRKPSFLFSAFGTPLFIFAIWLVIFLIETTGGSSPDLNNVFGYVDQSGVLSGDTLTETIEGDDDEDSRTYTFLPFADVETAEAALEAGAIDGYYIIPPDYEQGGIVRRVSFEDIPVSVDRALNRIVSSHLGERAGVDPAFIPLLGNPVEEMRVTLLDSGREFDGEFPVLLFLFPMALGIIFFMSAQTNSQFLMTGLVEEKQNRIIEILVTTIKPIELLLGKVVGLGGLGLLQFAVWMGLIVSVLVIAPLVGLLSGISLADVPFDVVGVGFVYFTLGYFLLASALAAVGVLVGNEQQSNMFVLIFMVPFYFVPLFSLSAFFQSPGGAYVTFISIFPLTSPLSMMVRMSVSMVPVWQIILGGVLLAITTVITAWLAGRIFRWGLLLYGAKITPMRLINVVLNRASS